jgi:hypothetical protein
LNDLTNAGTSKTQATEYMLQSRHFLYTGSCKYGIACLIVLLLTSCSSTIKQLYPDTFFQEDNIYENKPIGFLITFRGKWNITTNPNQMNRLYKSFAQTMQRSGGELLFMGSTVEALYGVKAIALNLNEDPKDYATYIRRINSSELENDSVPAEFITGNLRMTKWVYNKSGYRFVEFFFIIDTYNIRLSFWTKPDLFSNFLPVFEEIASTVTVTNGF